MSARRPVPTPKPEVVQTVCSMCGLDWARHKKAATAEECIRLLKDDLAGAEIRAAQRPWQYPWIFTTTNSQPIREQPTPIWEVSKGTTLGQIEGPR
jgi:hypothetical protein